MLSKFAAAAMGVIKSVIAHPRIYATPVSAEFGMRGEELSPVKALVIQETMHGSCRWDVSVGVARGDNSYVYDGNIEGFNRPQTTAQVIAGLDKIFVPERMDPRHIEEYQGGLRAKLLNTSPSIVRGLDSTL